MATTLQDLRNIGYDILREEQDTSAYPYLLIDLMINSAQQRICNGRLVNPLTKEEIRKGELEFLFTTQYYTNQPTTSLTATTTVGATTLNVGNTTNYPSSGVLYIAGNIVTYTGTTSTSFTGVTGVSFAFTAGTEVGIAFTLPADYSSALNLIYNNKFKLKPKLYNDMWEDLNSFKGTAYNRNRSTSLYATPYKVNPYYTIIDGAYLVLFNVNDTNALIQFRYEKLPTEMTDITDTVTIDNDIYAKSTIPYIAIGEMLFNRGEEARGAEILNFGMGQVKEMYNYYTKRNYEKISGVQYKTAKSKLNI